MIRALCLDQDVVGPLTEQGSLTELLPCVAQIYGLHDYEGKFANRYILRFSSLEKYWW